MATESLNTRVDVDVMDKFRTVCREKYDRDPNDLIREFITAFIDHRIRIIPTEGQKNERSELYHES